jgi:DNA-binding NarL/FixJ family response regulator
MRKINKINVAIVDDHTILREGLINLFKKTKKFTVVGHFNNGLELLQSMPGIMPDIVLLDIEMPVMNGKETLMKLKSTYKNVEVIMLSLHFSNLFVQDFFKLGARGFLSKGSDFNVLLEAIREVYDKGVFFSDNISRYSISELVDSQKIKPKVESFHLSEIEINILRLLCLEYSSKEIAAKLSFSERTVENYRQKLMLKTQSKNVIGLIIYAFSNQILNVKDFPKSDLT